MRAEFLPDGTICVSGAKGSEKFKRIWAGVGWPDKDDGYICVLGLRFDGRYHAIWEKRGGLWDLGEAGVEAKDRFLVDSIWVDGRDTVSLAYLRTLDGLSFYDDGTQADSQECALGRRNPMMSTCFRSTDTVAHVAAVPERIASNYRSALETIRGVTGGKRLLIHEKNCPGLVYALRQPLPEMLKSPVMKALALVISAFEESGDDSTQGLNPGDPWYTDFQR